MVLARNLEIGGWEASERAEIVRSLYGDILSFVLASIAVVVGVAMTAIQTGSTALWVVVAVNTLIPLVRMVTMLAVSRRPHDETFDSDFWERLYLWLGTLHVFSVGAWTTTVFFVGGGAFAQLVSFATAIGYLIGIQARNFPSPRIARLQTIAAGVPMVSGLLVQGTTWYLAYAGILLVFFLGILRTNGRMCETFLNALRAARKNEELAHFDSLTGLPNRAYMGRMLRERTLDRDRPFALHFVDLDRFKRINDTLGHSAGDAVLVETAKRFQEAVSQDAFVSRFAGDEFVFLQYGVTDEAAAEEFAQRLIEAVTAPYVVKGVPAWMSCSVGTAMFPRDGTDADLLTQQADTALYQVKKAGRQGHRMFASDMIDRESNRLRIENELSEALQSGHIKLFFQPLFDPATQRISTCEALLRWFHPERGAISPGEFLPIVEESRMMPLLTDWTIREACRVAKAWPPTVSVAINLSPSQLLRPEIVDVILAAIEENDLSASRVEIEITENILLGDHDIVLERLNALRSQGILIALDDFGTGYSNFSYISRLPIGKIKIDRSFIPDTGAERRRWALLQGLIRFVASLDLQVVVEGIETMEQLELVAADERVTQVQGFLLGRPLPEKAIATLVASLAALPCKAGDPAEPLSPIWDTDRPALAASA